MFVITVLIVRKNRVFVIRRSKELEEVQATEKVRQQFCSLRFEATMWEKMQSDNFSWRKFCLKKIDARFRARALLDPALSNVSFVHEIAGSRAERFFPQSYFEP